LSGFTDEHHWYIVFRVSGPINSDRTLDILDFDNGTRHVYASDPTPEFRAYLRGQSHTGNATTWAGTDDHEHDHEPATDHHHHDPTRRRFRRHIALTLL
jgi:hypothetical protein